MSNAQTLAIAPVRFVSVETEAQFVGDVAKACKSHAGADRNLVASLLSSAALIGRPVSEADWEAHIAPPVRKVLKAKHGADAARVYLSHTKCVTRARCGRPAFPVYAPDGVTLVTPGLALGKHWADQRTGKRAEGVNAYVKRVGALLKLATPNEHGVLILPEGYDLMGNPPASATPAAPEADATPATGEGSAGSVNAANGEAAGTPDAAKADNAEAHARAIMGTADLGALLLKVAGEHRDELVKFLRDTVTRAHEADAAAARNAKAGKSLNKAA